MSYEHLRNSQIDFREGRSCEVAAGELLEIVNAATESGVQCIEVFYDLSKSLNTVNHARLLKPWFDAKDVLHRITILVGCKLMASDITVRIERSTSRPSIELRCKTS